MNVLSKIWAALALLLTYLSCNAQIKNAKAENVKIYGNCSMCETTIENAGNLKKVALVDWNEETKMASLKYDSTKINKTEILKRIALAGYDSDQFLAPDDVYARLPECCQYKRINKTAMIKNEKSESHSNKNDPGTSKMAQEANPLKAVFANYFLLKDALVKSDQKAVSSMSKNLLSNINEVKMEKLSAEEHTVWMQVMSGLKSNADKISTLVNIEKQRNVFMELTASMYELIKVSKQDAPTYYQHCPMYNEGKGANWLSKENAIKNPYYGSQMLTCGKTVETIK